MQKNNKHQVPEEKTSKTEIHPGSTTQGGSNFGQGSTQLSNSSIGQGSELNSGASYEGEEDWNNEALRMEDLPPKKK